MILEVLSPGLRTPWTESTWIETPWTKTPSFGQRFPPLLNTLPETETPRQNPPLEGTWDCATIQEVHYTETTQTHNSKNITLPQTSFASDKYVQTFHCLSFLKSMSRSPHMKKRNTGWCDILTPKEGKRTVWSRLSFITGQSRQTSREQRAARSRRTSVRLQGLVQVKYAKAVNRGWQYLTGEALCLCFVIKLFNFAWRHFTLPPHCACVYKVTQRITTGNSPGGITISLRKGLTEQNRKETGHFCTF